MASDDDFKPRLGRMRARGSKRGRKFLHRVLAAANLARGGAALLGRRRNFSGSRIGRGAGVGRVLSARDRFAAFRQRRVIVKSRIVRLAGKGFAGAKAHLRYVERDGTTRDGQRGQLYGAETDKADRDAFLGKAQGDRNQFRFIVSPEDGAEYEDLKPLTRRLMSRMEEDLGTKLDWVAVDHFNTGHPHTHIILRGKDDRGQDLIIARDYISHGMRERAWRSLFSHALLFNPTDPRSAHYNPLLEVRRGEHEVRDVQNIADILVDPEGALERRNHWEKTSHSLLVGAILHVLHAEEEKTLARVATFLSDPQRPFVATLKRMMTTNHLGTPEAPMVHPVVASAAREVLNKSENERSGVLSTELSFGSNESDLVRAIRESAQQSGSRAGDQLVTRNLNIQPTLRVRPGWPLRVVVHKDIVLRPWTGPHG